MGKQTPRINRIFSAAGLVLIGSALLCPPSLALADTPTSQPAAKAAPTTRPTVRASIALPKLEQAYKLLASAEGTYGGHRDLAMKEIADTCLLLGRKLTPPNARDQKQALSDLQIRSVQMVLLELGRSVPAGDNNAAFLAHINGAISQLAQGITAERSQSNADDSSSASNGQGAGRGGGRNNGAANAAPGSRSGLHGPLIIDNPVNTNMVEIGALEDIYETLSFANHNYQGHRAKAMNAISRVVKILGATISGDGRGHERQIVSDQQLHYAQFLLHQVCQSFSVNDPKAILDDLTLADKELTTALEVREGH